jgi:hypothetical protein
MASPTTPQNRESHKKLLPKPKTESKSWQTRNLARKEKQAAHAAKLAAAKVALSTRRQWGEQATKGEWLTQMPYLCSIDIV